ncbi:MAG: cmpR 2 [Gemmatimonadetes bacterium]|nr:cmpR 2 [Gemmatimonadota bacterium]
MDVRQLEMFRAVAEEGSFTRAAVRLHVSQSAVSRQLQLLESELGGPLLHRSVKGVTLTAEGELLLRTANRIHRDIREAVWEISETQKLKRGQLRIAGGGTVCLYVLPQLLKRFRAQHKDVDLLVKTGSTTAVLQLLRNHQLDLALLTLPIAGTDMEVRSAIREELVVVTAPKHPLTQQHVIEAQSLADHPLVLFEPGSNTRILVDQFFAEQQMPMNVAMETESVEIIKAMVASGLGIALVPYVAIAADMRSKRFAWARIRGQRLYREQGWVYLKSDHVPRPILEVLRVFDAMKSEFSEKPPVR